MVHLPCCPVGNLLTHITSSDSLLEILRWMRLVIIENFLSVIEM